MIRTLALGLLIATPAFAQQDIQLSPGRAGDEPSLSQSESTVESLLLGETTDQESATTGTGVVLRGLDKLNASVKDVTLTNGTATTLGRIEIAVQECRYPSDDPAGDAYAYLTIREAGQGGAVFSGWMIASAPALNPMDHPRYDVWVLRCTTS